MDAGFGGKTEDQWTTLLRKGDLAEQCAAALALAEFVPMASATKTALMSALSHPEPAVQYAARIGLGVAVIVPEFRRKMFDGLTGNDAYEKHTILRRLDQLTTTEANSTLAQSLDHPATFEWIATTAPKPADQAPSSSASPHAEAPDIAVVSVVPWWLLFIAVAACVLLAWLLRSVWWAKWAMAVLAALGGVFLFFLLMRQQGGSLSLVRFRARARLAGAGLLAGALGFAIGWLFPAGVVLIDNANQDAVRLLVDDTDWLTIGAGESTSRFLGSGKHRLTVQSVDGKKMLDAHDIEVTDHGPYVLNVLGSQIYFKGTARYADRRPSEIDVITDKWFRVPAVEYVFREPPESIPLPGPGEIRPKGHTERTFITKAAPPGALERQKD